MGWPKPYNAGENPNPRDKSWRLGGTKYEYSEHDVSNADIDRAIKQGKNPKNVFGGKIKKMSADSQRKVNARIRDRKNKAGQ